MTTTGDSPTPIVHGSAIAHGDHFALEGDWPTALTYWRTALDGPDAAEASFRIRWFVNQTNHNPHFAVPSQTRRNAYRSLFAAAITGGTGTGITLLGIGRSGIESTVIAIVAWTCFAVAIALTLLFARLLESRPGNQRPLAIDGHTVGIAMKSAATMHATSNRPPP